MISIRRLMVTLALLGLAACESAPGDRAPPDAEPAVAPASGGAAGGASPGAWADSATGTSAKRYYGQDKVFPRQFLVYYAADRKSLTGETQATPADKLQYGRLPVRIPKKFAKTVDDGLPLTGNEYKTITLCKSDVTTYAEPSDFMKDVATAVKKSATNDILIFVHGFNNSFDESIQRTASLSFRGRFRGVPIAYSWAASPSVGTAELKAAYKKDAVSAKATFEKFAKFLSEVAATSGAQRIHLAAHSMGNRIIVNALKQMPNVTKTRIANVMMFAPDVDEREFRELARSSLTARQPDGSIGSYRYKYWSTLYASDCDLALLASWRINEERRAGLSLAPIDGVQVVDTAAVKCDWLDHAYFDCFESELIRQLHLDNASGQPPGSPIHALSPKGDGTFEIPCSRDDATIKGAMCVSDRTLSCPKRILARTALSLAAGQPAELISEACRADSY